jgi:ribosomal protein S19
MYRYNIKGFAKKKVILSRGSSIPTLFEDDDYYIYNGKIFNSLTINPLLENKKFGEFSITRKPFFFSKKNKKKR